MNQAIAAIARCHSAPLPRKYQYPQWRYCVAGSVCFYQTFPHLRFVAKGQFNEAAALERLNARPRF